MAALGRRYRQQWHIYDQRRIVDHGQRDLGFDEHAGHRTRRKCPRCPIRALTASGQLALDGSVVVSLNGFMPSAGQMFDVLDWGPGSLVGVFSSLHLPGLAGGLVWDTSQLYTTGVLSVRLPGDFNFNGVVDAADYVVWRKGLRDVFAK